MKTLEDMLADVAELDDTAAEATIAVTNARVALQEQMIADKTEKVQIDTYEEDGTPGKPISAALQDKVTSDLDLSIVEGLLDDTEKAPFTNFKMTMTQLESGVRDGEFGEDKEKNASLLTAVSRSRIKNGKLIVHGLSSNAK